MSVLIVFLGLLPRDVCDWTEMGVRTSTQWSALTTSTLTRFAHQLFDVVHSSLFSLLGFPMDIWCCSCRRLIPVLTFLSAVVVSTFSSFQHLPYVTFLPFHHMFPANVQPL